MAEEGFYPEGMEGGDKKLPKGKNFGSVAVNCAVAYHREAAHQIKGFEGLVMFIDKETPNREHSYGKTEIHFGISGNIAIEPTWQSNVKPHIDIYIPIEEIGNLITALLEMKGSAIADEVVKHFQKRLI